MDYELAKRAVVEVREGGRGFIVATDDGPRVITAAHCLLRLPVPASDDLVVHKVGPLGVLAECLFVDPVADVAVLGPPDPQAAAEQWLDYTHWVQGASVLSIADAPEERGPAWLLSLNGQWFECKVERCGGGLLISNAAKEIVGGMSGSPIVPDDGSAIGVVCVSCGSGELHTGGGPNPRLAYHLPARFLPGLCKDR
jgi:hypothetical protein